jgi:hypothetical protein
VLINQIFNNMKNRFLIFSAALLLLLCAEQISADVRLPERTPTPNAGKIVPHTGLTIVPDSKEVETRLQITQNDLRELRAALDGAPPSNSSGLASITHSSTRTIIAGTFLFLSLSFGGVWLARSTTRRTGRALGVALIATAILSAVAIIARANAGPPGYYRWRNLPQNLKEGRATNGGVNIEIVPDGYGMKLIVPLRPTSQTPGEE